MFARGKRGVSALGGSMRLPASAIIMRSSSNERYMVQKDPARAVAYSPDSPDRHILALHSDGNRGKFGIRVYLGHGINPYIWSTWLCRAMTHTPSLHPVTPAFHV